MNRLANQFGAVTTKCEPSRQVFILLSRGPFFILSMDPIWRGTR
jgi:hypothetical protein